MEAKVRGWRSTDTGYTFTVDIEYDRIKAALVLQVEGPLPDQERRPTEFLTAFQKMMSGYQQLAASPRLLSWPDDLQET